MKDNERKWDFLLKDNVKEHSLQPIPFQESEQSEVITID